MAVPADVTVRFSVIAVSKASRKRSLNTSPAWTAEPPKSAPNSTNGSATKISPSSAR